MSEVVIAVATVVYVVATLTILVLMYWQTKANQMTNKISTFKLVMEKMEQTRSDRHKLRAYVKLLKRQQSPLTFPLPDEVDGCADRVARAFDYLGLLERTRIVDSKLVDLFYSVPLVFLYDDILGGYAAYLRDESRRGATHLWEFVQFYERVKNVPKNHPGITSLDKWPENTRRKQ